MRPRILTVSAILVFLVAASASPLAGASAASRFKYKGSRHETGVLYRYERTDLEGTKTGALLLYVASKTKFEVLRLGPGREAAELTTGELGWDTASARQLELGIQRKGQGRTQAASVSLNGESLGVTVQDQAVYRGASGPAKFDLAISQLPVHLVRLDFVTLSLVMRQLVEPEKELEVGLVTEAKQGSEGSGFLAYAGTAKVSFVEDVDRDGIHCSKFKITGPALGGQEGNLWLRKDKELGPLQEAEIPIPSGEWPDIHLSLKGVEKMSEGAWDTLKANEAAAFLSK